MIIMIFQIFQYIQRQKEVEQNDIFYPNETKQRWEYLPKLYFDCASTIPTHS